MSYSFDTLAAEYKEAEQLFFKAVLEVLLRFKTSLHATGVRAKVKDEKLIIELVVEGEWVQWNDAPLYDRCLVLGDAPNVLGSMNRHGHSMLNSVRRCKEHLAPTPRAGTETP